MVNNNTCAKLLNVSGDTALRELTYLKSKGLINRKGVGRTIYCVLKWCGAKIHRIEYGNTGKRC